MANISELDIFYQNLSRMTDINGSFSENIDDNESSGDMDFLIRLIWMFVGYPILALGTVGHLLVIVLVLLNKRMRSFPLSIFLVTMSVSGLMALYVGLLPTIIKYQTHHRHRAEDRTTETGCRLFMAAIYFFFQLYSWMEAIVAVERMCAVRWPLTHRTLSTRHGDAIAIAVIVVVLLAINGIHFKIFGNSQGTCDVEDDELFQAWQYVHSVLYIILPVAVMLPANVATLHAMYSSLLKESPHIKKAKPTTIMMLILNAIFVVTALPILVGNYSNLQSSELEAVRVAWVVSRLMMYLGCSLTFLVYVAVAARFRQALAEIFNSGKKNIVFALLAMPCVSGNSGGTSADAVTEGSSSTPNVGLVNSNTASNN